MRDKVLKKLMDSHEEYISGEDMSTSLGITRAAVWKHIKVLKEEGYEIESRSGLGYRLMGIPDILDEVTISMALNTEIMGRNMEVHDIIDSTNNRARELAIEGAPEGTLIIAENQSKGRGRLGRNWVSPKGKGIWMSLILRPDIPPEEAPGMTAMAAVGIRNALHKASELPVGIKWPNDIIIDGKKVCGILTEMQGDIDRVHYIVLGMGINANMGEEDFLPEFASRATSLRIATGAIVERREVIALIMEAIEKVYIKYMEDKDFGAILKECREHSVTLNKRVKVVGRDHSFEGRALDFHRDGSLLVEKDDGDIVKVMSGDISVRGEEGYV